MTDQDQAAVVPIRGTYNTVLDTFYFYERRGKNLAAKIADKCLTTVQIAAIISGR